MKTELKEWTVEDLVERHRKGILKIDWEYQRGAVWKEPQMRLLIDSVMRRYQIPLIYLRKNQKGDAEFPQTVLDIIDGQQRINALRGFADGVIIEERPEGRNVRPFKSLYDPQEESNKHRFPTSLQNTTCSWAGKSFKNFDDDDKSHFMNCKVSVALMECTDDEARDLFIRLQGGSSLMPQEVRDSWPGNFNKLVLKIGGKPQFNLPGHPFFQQLMRAKPASDRGKTRQFVAQLLKLFLRQKSAKEEAFATIQSSALDGDYRHQVGLPLDSPEVRRFEEILDMLVVRLGGGMRPPLKNHDALHLVLFTSMLWDEYAPVSAWQGGIAGAVDKFLAQIAVAKQVKELTGEESAELKDFWNYYWMTRSRADAAETIRARHVIYERHMLRFLGPDIRPTDPQRLYTATQREAIYYRDEKCCQKCKKAVAWEDAEIHHQKPHSEGGRTTLENGVLMHAECHKQHHQSGQGEGK